MTSLLQAGPVACERQDIDHYGRPVAICKTSSGVDIGQEMVRRGLAVAYRTYSLKYLPDETFARQHRRGAWATGFESPLQYRRDHPRN